MFAVVIASLMTPVTASLTLEELSLKMQQLEQSNGELTSKIQQLAQINGELTSKIRHLEQNDVSKIDISRILYIIAASFETLKHRKM